MKQVMIQWGDVQPFLGCANVAPKSHEKLLNLLQSDGVNLLMELANTIEGNCPLTLSCFEVLFTVKASIKVKHWPNIRAVTSRLAAECQVPALEQQ